MSVVGFDFGTTNSLVSLVRGGRVINFFDDHGLPTPSVVCYEAGQVITGRAAKERLATAGLGVYGNVVRSPKVLLGNESVFVDGVERSVTDIVADFLKAVRKDATSKPARGLKDLDAAVVTIPVNFDGPRRVALRDAFRMAGIRIVQFVHEPLAALYGHMRAADDQKALLRRFDRQLVLVFDWGGGTLDLTLCRVEGGMLLQVANDGTDEVGGDVFDNALRNEVVRRVRAERGLGESVQPQPDAHARLLHRCERAKIDLSGRDRVQVYVDHFFRGVENDSLDLPLARDDLERIVGPLVDAGVARIRTLLEAAQVSPPQVALCLATGGMVNMPMIRSRLHELFGASRVHFASSGGAAIAEGAAWIAHDRAGLRLAKSVELLLARNSHLPLVKCGTQMPMEGEVCQDQWGLYCVDPRDGFAKMQLLSPMRPGPRAMPNDHRNVLGTMTIRVHPEARPFLERIQLSVEIDDDLILSARARSTMQGDTDTIEVHNLEFAVPLGGTESKPGTEPTIGSKDDQLHHAETPPRPPTEKGAVTIRANVADEILHSLVPGELWYKHHPEEFDTRREPPRIQVEERLYYQPCARCGRPINDPLCRCGSSRAAV
ncbi:MAG: Hsp70 family protein [Verrucomicrobia bacterium]|nr:Hsp70 family protein [Verrucomicrobiota bacterium]